MSTGVMEIASSVCNKMYIFFQNDVYTTFRMYELFKFKYGKSFCYPDKCV